MNDSNRLLNVNAIMFFEYFKKCKRQKCKKAKKKKKKKKNGRRAYVTAAYAPIYPFPSLSTTQHLQVSNTFRHNPTTNKQL